jgi:hypothetical protein
VALARPLCTRTRSPQFYTLEIKPSLITRSHLAYLRPKSYLTSHYYRRAKAPFCSLHNHCASQRRAPGPGIAVRRLLKSRPISLFPIFLAGKHNFDLVLELFCEPCEAKLPLLTQYFPSPQTQLLPHKRYARKSFQAGQNENLIGFAPYLNAKEIGAQ